MNERLPKIWLICCCLFSYVLCTAYRTLDGGGEYVEVETVLVHEGGVLGGPHILDGLGADGGPVHRVIALPAPADR